MRRTLLLVGVALTAGCPLLADLDEDHFQAYSAGELLGQNAWSVDAPANGGVVPTTERVEIRDKENQEPGKSLVWKGDFEQTTQARIVKRFPPTISPQVEVILSVYIAEEPKGMLYFDQPGVGSLKLYFIRGKINVLSEGGNTGVSSRNYHKRDWTNIRLKVDFESHTAELFMEDSPVGAFQIDANLSEFSQVNFYAGSPDAENQIGNLVIRSIENNE